MGKYTEERIRGYILYFTMKCLAEGIIHVHANKGKMTEDRLTIRYGGQYARNT